jgi:hypothetical protein
MSMFPTHRHEAPRSLSSIVEHVEHGMAFQAHCLTLALERHKRDPDPAVHSTAHRLATALRDFVTQVENATSILSPSMRVAIAAR